MQKPSQHFNVGSTVFQSYGSTLKWRWSDFENETKSGVGFSALHNADKTLDPDIETTSEQRCSTLKQSCKTLIQRCINVILT